MYSIVAILEISLAPTVAAPALARAEVAAWLAPHSEELTDIAQLLISELVTNCIRHARIARDEPLLLTASMRAATLRLELRDTGTHGDVARRRPRQDGDTGGFGLDLVDQLSSTWGVERDARGTTVWLELPAPATA